MKAILINAEKGEVSSVDYNGDFEMISKFIGGNCRLFTTVHIYENDDMLYVDDDGLQNGTIQGFIHKNYDTPLLGNGLLLGTDIDSGGSVDVQTPLETVREDVSKYIALINGTVYEFENKPHPFLIETDTGLVQVLPHLEVMQ